MAAPGSNFGRKFGRAQALRPIALASPPGGQLLPQSPFYGVTDRGEDGGRAVMLRSSALIGAAAVAAVIVHQFFVAAEVQEQPSPVVRRAFIAPAAPAAPPLRPARFVAQEEVDPIRPVLSRPPAQQPPGPLNQPAKYAYQEETAPLPPVMSRALIPQAQAPFQFPRVKVSIPLDDTSQLPAVVSHPLIQQFISPTPRAFFAQPPEDTSLLQPAFQRKQPASLVATAPPNRQLFVAPLEEANQLAPIVKRQPPPSNSVPITRVLFAALANEPEQPGPITTHQTPPAVAASVVVVRQTFTQALEHRPEQPGPVITRAVIQQVQAPLPRGFFTQPLEHRAEQPGPVVSRTVIQQFQAPLPRGFFVQPPEDTTVLGPVVTAPYRAPVAPSPVPPRPQIVVAAPEDYYYAATVTNGVNIPFSPPVIPVSQTGGTYGLFDWANKKPRKRAEKLFIDEVAAVVASTEPEAITTIRPPDTTFFPDLTMGQLKKQKKLDKLLKQQIDDDDEAAMLLL